MIKENRGSVGLIAIVILILLNIPICAQSKEMEKILFISSYNPNHINFNKQISGIKNGLGQSVELQIEYMDYKVFNSPENERNFYSLLNYKLSIYESIDGVILADDEALAFALKYKDELFKDVPLVFFGIADDNLARGAIEKGLASGIVERESINANVELITTLHKEVKNIIFLEDKGDAFVEYFFDKYKEKYNYINFERIFLGYEDYSNFENRIKELGDDDAIIMFYPAIDVNGRVVSRNEIINSIKINTTAPVYELLNETVGKGSIGGKVINQYEHGKRAAEILRKLINGENPIDLYIDDDNANIYMFDYEILHKYNINSKMLPEDSVVLNEPVPFFEKHKAAIIPLSVLSLGLILIIVALVCYVINRINYEKELLKVKNMAEEAKKVAEDASKAKSYFISNISHELRTPITVMMSVIQLLKLKLPKQNCKLDNGISKNLNTLNQNCYRLLRLVNNVIDTTKVESESTDFKLNNVNMVNLVERTVNAVVPYSKLKNIEMIFDTNEEEVIMAVDTSKIERVFLNLLSNAIKFSVEGSEILVNTIVEESNIVIEVLDQGSGIEEENKKKIFERFVQIDESFTRKNEGCGIGLSLVKSFVELHSGTITVESNIGRGSKFIVDLPINRLKDEEIMDLEENIDYIKFKADVEFSDIYY